MSSRPLKQPWQPWELEALQTAWAEGGAKASQQLTAAAEAWELGMTCLRLDSREYRALCAAGRAAERSYQYLWLLAEQRG